MALPRVYFGACACCIAVAACGAFSGRSSDDDDSTPADASIVDGTKVGQSDGADFPDGPGTTNDSGGGNDIDAASPDSAVPGIIFLSSMDYPSANAFTSLAKADGLCIGLAANGSKTKGKTAWVAWLSDERDGGSARARVSAKPFSFYVRSDNAPIGTLARLLDAGPMSPISFDENGMNVTKCVGAGVWTGTAADGTAVTGLTCSNWTDVNGSSEIGACDMTNGSWTARASTGCNQTGIGIYCVEQTK